MKRSLSALLALTLLLPLPALAAKEVPAQTYGETFAAYTEGWQVERRLEAPTCSVVLMWSPLSGLPETVSARDYVLALISKEGESEERFQRLLLPSTAAVGEPRQYPTDRAPDSMTLSEDGTALTYMYRFEDALFNQEGQLLHDPGRYIYQVDLATGELEVTYEGELPSPAPSLGAEGTTFVDISPEDWFASYVDICVEEGLMEGVGAGRFDPQGTVTHTQAITLASRIHHILQGGDGKLPSAPEDYGILTVTFENGTTLRFDSTQYRFHPVPMSAVLGAPVEGEQRKAMDWLEWGERVTAAISLGSSPPAPCLAYWNSLDEEKGHMSFRNNYEGSEEEQAAFHRIEGKLISVTRPPAGDWFRDTVYYLESAELTKKFPLHLSSLDDAADRSSFVVYLNAVAEGLLAPVLNHVTDFPDSTLELYSEEVLMKDVILGFYNAGILTGKDDRGTFDPQGTLTRAECAAILSRLMRPELRLEFQPAPMTERYSYTLTYLMDDPMTGHTTTHPVLPILTADGENNGFLTLDGDLIPWPGGEKPISLYQVGDYLWCSFWIDGVEQGGLMDKTGSFALPLQSRFYYAYPVEGGGFLASTEIYTHGVHALLDEEGRVVKELGGGLSQWDVWELYPDRTRERFGPERWGGGVYVDQAKHPVSQGFDWAGELTDDGRGFVGKDGKIYRIQFTEL